MTDIVKQLRADALEHFAEASQWDMAPEATINWQRGLSANKAADEIETLRQRVKDVQAELTRINALHHDCAAQLRASLLQERSECARADRAEAELAVLKHGQDEPVAEVVSHHQAGLYDALPVGTKLYTSATIQETCFSAGDMADAQAKAFQAGRDNNRAAIGELVAALETVLSDMQSGRFDEDAARAAIAKHEPKP